MPRSTDSQDPAAGGKGSRRGARVAPRIAAALGLMGATASAGCYSMRSSSGAGETEFAGERVVDARDVALPEGYALNAVVRGLTFPTGVTFDGSGRPVVVESGYSYGEAFTRPRVLAVEPDGAVRELASASEDAGPWTGITFHAGVFFVAAGDVLHDGKILRIDPRGAIEPVVDGLPSRGDHHTNGPVLGPDGWLYFAQGTATNAGVVGPDNAEYGWLKRYPEFHDIPGGDVVLAGHNVESGNPLTEDPADRAITGAFRPFGTAAAPGEVVAGQIKAGGSILRVRPEGGPVERVAWGLRNPFGLAFSPDGQLFVTENAYDDRGSRPVWGSADFLWAIEPDTWYGWPDYVGGIPITDPRFAPRGEPPRRFALAEHPQTPPRPRARFGVHASANGFDFSTNAAFGHRGQAFVALFGDQAPVVGKVLAPVGCKVVRVDPHTGVIIDFAVNRGPKNGPASKIGGGGLERPIAARFSPDGRALYIVDFGVLLQHGNQSIPQPGTGVLWRVTREEPAP